MSREEATQFLAFIIGRIGGGFHPDNKMSDYVNSKTGDNSFNEDEIKRYGTMLAQAWGKFGDDIYGVSMEICNKYIPFD